MIHALKKQMDKNLLKRLKLISEISKIKIIRELQTGEVCVCDLAKKVDMEQSLLSHHLRKLKKADLLVERKVGRWVHYSLNIDAFSQIETKPC